MRFEALLPGDRFYFDGMEHVKLWRTVTRSLGACATCTNPENVPGNAVSLCDGDIHFLEAGWQVRKK